VAHHEHIGRNVPVWPITNIMPSGSPSPSPRLPSPFGRPRRDRSPPPRPSTAPSHLHRTVHLTPPALPFRSAPCPSIHRGCAGVRRCAAPGGRGTRAGIRRQMGCLPSLPRGGYGVPNRILLTVRRSRFFNFVSIMNFLGTFITTDTALRGTGYLIML